jgi:hypothetical protein
MRYDPMYQPHVTNAQLDERLARVEEKLDRLLEALAEEEQPIGSLDGSSFASPRDEAQPL